MEKRGNIAIVVVFIVFLATIFYFWSDPFKAKVDKAVLQATSWTPENIQKDPVGYLTWAKNECNVLSQKLEAREIALKTKENEYKRNLLEKESELVSYSGLLTEAKTTFVTASAARSFPVLLRNIQLSEAQLKTKIVEAYQQIELINKAVPAIKNTIQMLQQQLAAVESRKAEIAGLSKKIGSDIELAKLKTDTAGLANLSNEFTSILDTTSAVINPENIPSINEMAAMTASTSADVVFEKIMTE